MNDKNIFNQRLLKFADHLAGVKNHPEAGLFETVTLVALEVEETIRIPYDVRYHAWVFGELPACFNEWYYEEKYGNAVWEGTDPTEGTVASVIDFFDLSLDEFGHLFDVEGFQLIDRFGGEILSDISDGSVIANNIIQLVNSKITRF